jgi:acetyltransferase, GNAT family
MNYIIRKLKQSEIKVLNIFLYEAIFITEGAEAPEKEIINHPELQVYVKDFGKESDVCYVAQSGENIVAAVWTRIMNDYGHIDDETPSLAISVLKAYRSKGIGSELMRRILKELKEKGYKQVSLSVQKENYAVNLYKKAGFEVICDKEEEYIMLCKL